MAEQLFASIGKTGITITPITGASGSLGLLKAIGTSYNSNMPRTVEYNGKNMLISGSSNHASLRGMNLIIFNRDMTVDFIATYDLYGYPERGELLASKMNDILEDQIAVLTTYDAIRSSDVLDSAFKYFRSTVWPDNGYFNKDIYHRRSAYAGVLCGKKRSFVMENFQGQVITPEENVAIIEESFPDPLTLGHKGYSTDIISDDEIHKSTGVVPEIIKWFDNTPLGDTILRKRDQFVFNSTAQIDAVSSVSNAVVRYEIKFFAEDGSLISEITKDIECVEGWEQFEIRGTIPEPCQSITMQASHVPKTGDAAVMGVGMVKNTTMHLSDNDFVETTSASIGLRGTSISSYDDSLGGFGQYDPKGYYDSNKSSSNLLNGIDIPQQTSQPVRWFNKILDTDTDRAVIKTNDDVSLYTPRIDIDPNKWYYVSVWVNKQAKLQGQYMLGFRAYDKDGAHLETTKTDDFSYKSIYTYSQRPQYDSLEEKQWYLLQGFILPHDVTYEQSVEFIEANNDFYGWGDIYENGIGLSDDGNGYYGWVNNKDCDKGSILFLDYYNKGDDAESLWALPIIREIKVASVDIDDSAMTSISLTM